MASSKSSRARARARARTRTASPRGRTPDRRFPVLVIAACVVVLLGVVAVLVSAGSGGDGTADGVEQTRPVQVSGAPLAPHVGADDLEVGSVAPEVDGARFDGTPLRIGDDGRPKVLVFLAHWCPHCQREVPSLTGWLADNGAPDDVDLYGVATATSADLPNYPPSAWLDREGFGVPTLADDADDNVAQAFGLSAFPYFVALDADNRVVARVSGELTIAQWEALVELARTGTPLGAS